MTQMKEQLMKAAYHTSFNSPNRLSQHNNAYQMGMPPPMQFQIPMFSGGLQNMYETSMDERKTKATKPKVA
jgi:hypothetical protein